MSQSVQRIATRADLWLVPENTVGEILAGELVMSPMLSPRHSLARSGLSYELTGPYQRGRGGPGDWWILTEVELHLSGEALVPDLAGWRRSRMPEVPEDGAIEVAPDWVCEVLAPSTEAIDRGIKARSYAREGIGYYWLLDPILRTLEVLRLHQGRWLVLDVFSGTMRPRAEPFDAIPLALGALWPKGGER